MAMMISKDTMSGVVDLLNPGLRGDMAYKGQRVKSAELWVDPVEDSIQLGVVHVLFTRQEILDRSYVKSFRSRVAEAILATSMPNGRQLVVDRRSFLARAARVRKNKPKKVLGA
jgi:hypothetical protein